MKLSLNEKRLAVGALGYAIAATQQSDFIKTWRYTNLRKKIETAIRNERSE